MFVAPKLNAEDSTVVGELLDECKPQCYRCVYAFQWGFITPFVAPLILKKANDRRRGLTQNAGKTAKK